MSRWRTERLCQAGSALRRSTGVVGVGIRCQDGPSNAVVVVKSMLFSSAEAARQSYMRRRRTQFGTALKTFQGSGIPRLEFASG